MIPSSNILLQKSSIRTIILVLTALSTLFSILEVSHCSFFSIQSDEGTFAKGLFHQALYDSTAQNLGCVDYSGEDSGNFDPLFKAARAFGAVTALWSCTNLLLCSIVILACPEGSRRLLWNLARNVTIFATICQLLVFIILVSDICQEEKCTLQGVGILAVFHVFLLVGVAIVQIREPCPNHPMITWYTTSPNAQVLRTHGGVGPGYNIETDTPVKHENDAEDLSVDTIVEGPPTVSQSVISRISVVSTLLSSLSHNHEKSFRLSFFVTLSISWIMSIVTTRNCTLLLKGPEQEDRSEYSALGLFRKAFYDNNDNMVGCLVYDDQDINNFDGSMKIARAMGVLTSFITSLLVSMYIHLMFYQYSNKQVWNFIRTLLPCTAITQLMVLFVHGSSICKEYMEEVSMKCVPGASGIALFFNFALLLILSYIAFCVRAPSEPLFKAWKTTVHDGGDVPFGDDEILSRLPPLPVIPVRLAVLPEENETDDSVSDSNEPTASFPSSEPESVTIRVEFAPGERKVIKEIMHADGSKTITTTIEEISDNEEDDIAADDGDSYSKQSNSSTLTSADSLSRTSSLGPKFILSSASPSLPIIVENESDDDLSIFSSSSKSTTSAMSQKPFWLLQKERKEMLSKRSTKKGDPVIKEATNETIVENPATEKVMTVSPEAEQLPIWMKKKSKDQMAILNDSDNICTIDSDKSSLTSRTYNVTDYEENKGSAPNQIDEREGPRLHTNFVTANQDGYIKRTDQNELESVVTAEASITNNSAEEASVNTSKHGQVTRQLSHENIEARILALAMSSFGQERKGGTTSEDDDPSPHEDTSAMITETETNISGKDTVILDSPSSPFSIDHQDKERESTEEIRHELNLQYVVAKCDSVDTKRVTADEDDTTIGENSSIIDEFYQEISTSEQAVERVVVEKARQWRHKKATDDTNP